MQNCHVCHEAALRLVELPNTVPRLVSSDVRVVPGTVTWAVCDNCGTIQKYVDEDWLRMSADIYDHYDINHQSAGDEPRLFNTAFGSGPRSLIVVRHVLHEIAVVASGKLLDVGCSNGNLLKTFHTLRPEWELYGSEISEGWKVPVLALPGVKDFYIGREATFPLKYDIVSLTHVLEHIPDPRHFVRELSRNLAPGGHLVIAVPNIRQNPIDLLIADHASHFDENSLGSVLSSAGLEVINLSTATISKELIAIARVTSESQSFKPRPAAETHLELCQRYFRLIEGVRAAAEKARNEALDFGIMGSSIAAAWLFEELGGAVDFFVDEDESRQGHSLMKKPIVGYAGVPANATVFIPMAAVVAEAIMARASGYSIRFSYLDWNRVDANLARD